MSAMTGRWAALAVVAALALFGAGFALAEPEADRAPGTAALDAAPQPLDVEPVSLRAGVQPATAARLRPTPTPRPRKRPAPSRTAAVATPVVPSSTPEPATTPLPVSTPAPVATAAPVIPRPAPTAPPKPAPTPQTPSYVGSGFDDSG